MSLTTSLTLSRDAWRLLRGVTCLYKPPGYPAGKLINLIRYKLGKDLNRMERKVERDESKLHLSGGRGDIIPSSGGGGVVLGHCSDYSVHSSVLGPAYAPDDIRCMYVNKLSDRASGVLLVGVNEGVGGNTEARALRNAKLLTTFHINGEWGRATSTGWATGKTRKCHTWRHLVGRPWLVDQCLSNIQAGHQARAWTVSNLALDTQEAFEQALKGPVKPDLLSETLVYSIKVKEWNLPSFTIEVKCIEGQSDTQEYLVRMVEEIGLKCKTVAHVTGIRCSALGPFTTNESLLIKHINLQNILNNISDNRKLWRETKFGHTSERGFRRKENKELIPDKGEDEKTPKFTSLID